MDTRAVEVSVFYIFRTIDKTISRCLTRNILYPLITTVQQEGTRAIHESWSYICVAHGNDGVMEVCFVHNTTFTIDLTSCFLPWEALLR